MFWFLCCGKPGLETETLLDPAGLHIQSLKAEDNDWLLLLHWKAEVLLYTWDVLMFPGLKILGCWHSVSPAWFWLSPTVSFSRVMIKAIYSQKPNLAAWLNLIRATINCQPSVFKNENGPRHSFCTALQGPPVCPSVSAEKIAALHMDPGLSYWSEYPNPSDCSSRKNKKNTPLVRAVFLEFGTP